jgi:hypothetical protein
MNFVTFHFDIDFRLVFQHQLILVFHTNEIVKFGLFLGRDQEN